AEALQIDFDFLDHRLAIETSWGGREAVPLAPKSVADFYAEVMAALARLGVEVRIWTRPVEVPEPIPLEQARLHTASYPDARLLLARGQQRGVLAGRCQRAAQLLQLRRPRAGRLHRSGRAPEQRHLQRHDGRVRPALRERAHGGPA